MKRSIGDGRLKFHRYSRIYDIKMVYNANEFLAIETDTTRP